jgi:hypothetical protein
MRPILTDALRQRKWGSLGPEITIHLTCSPVSAQN